MERATFGLLFYIHRTKLNRNGELIGKSSYVIETVIIKLSKSEYQKIIHDLEKD